MAHEITESDSAIFYMEPAWHKLGIVVKDAISPLDAIAKAKLDWLVNKTNGIEAGGVYTNKYCALIRSDNNEILSVQSIGYQPFQNLELFQLAYTLGADVKVESALSMRGGRKVVCLLRGDSFAPSNSKTDQVARYLALINSHDGSLALSCLPTSVRIQCANTLSMAVAQGVKNTFKVTHTGNMEQKKKAMEEALLRYKNTGALFQEKVEILSRKLVSTEDLQRFWLDVWGELVEPVVANPTNEKEAANRAAAAREIATWSQTFDLERAAINGPASLWQAANAVTKNIQHRKTKRSFDSLAYYNLMGAGQDKSITVMRKALALV